MNLWLKDMYAQHGYSYDAAWTLVQDQGLSNPDQFWVMIDNNVNDICSVIIKPGGIDANETPYNRHPFSVMTQKNMKLDSFLFYHR